MCPIFIMKLIKCIIISDHDLVTAGGPEVALVPVQSLDPVQSRNLGPSRSQDLSHALTRSLSQSRSPSHDLNLDHHRARNQGQN